MNLKMDQMSADWHSSARSQIAEFISRDYVADSRRLNRLFGRGSREAGFTDDMPPTLFCGDPFALRPGHSIAVIGINPRWRGWNDPKGWATREYLPIKTCVDLFRAGDWRQLDNFIRLRGSYFLDDSKIYYGPYFTKLGGLIGSTFFPSLGPKNNPRQFAKEIFRRLIFKADFLPWFSTDAASIDISKIERCKDEAIYAYCSLLSNFLLAMRPRWIQCNGFQCKDLIEAGVGSLKLERPFDEIRIPNGKRVFCGYLRDDSKQSQISSGIPLFMHGFTNSPSGLQTLVEFRQAAEAFREWVNNKELFEFV